MKGNWIRKPEGDACTIFVHGILARESDSWRHENGAYWPQLLAEEAELNGIGIYAFFYRTNVFSGSYSLGDAVDAMRESLKLDGVLRSARLDFVCHSMGGILVRRFLVKRAVELIDQGKRIGLFLVASPSLGSDYADWLQPLAKVFGHKQAEALRFVRDNQWLTDLNKDFKNLKEAGKLPIRGRELIEDRFVVLPGLWRKQVVEPFSGSLYFADELKIPGSDHFSIAKPDGKDALQHRALREFLLDGTRSSVEAIDISTETGDLPERPVAEPPPIAAATAAASTAADTQALIGAFLGADPLRGQEALDTLLGRDDTAQAMLFGSRIDEPATFQVWRRWYHYVRMRHARVTPLLLERLAEPRKYRDSHTSALLCGGIPCKSTLRDGIYELLESGFNIMGPIYFTNFDFYDQHGHYDALLLAHGHAGGAAATLWNIASGNDFFWKKIRHAGFCGACAAFARCDADAIDTLERFVSTFYDDKKCYTPSRGMETIGPARQAFLGESAVQDANLGFEAALGAFSKWQRGAVADRILRDWSRHDHWRVRWFGAMILRYFRFDRLKQPLMRWRDAEPDPETRKELQNAIDELDLEILRETGSVAGDAADMPALRSGTEGEAIVALARFGYAHPQLDTMRSSEQWYDRAVAALAFGYLQRNDKVLRTARLLQEASHPLETLMLATAAILLGRDDIPGDLHDILVDSQSSRHQSLTDIRYIHRFLQIAISDALTISGTAAQKTAWEREFGPLTADG